MTDQPQRWTKATVYPDMWLDPDDDPRKSADVSPDGELPTLQDYLHSYRLTLLMKCADLDPEQLARRSGIAVREILVHRIEEYARHCGHADLLRECVDGRVGQ